VQAWQRLNAAFPDDGGAYSIVISDQNVAGGEKLYEGTNTGPLPVGGSEMTVPPTGNHVSIREADFIVMEGGQVTKHTCYYDTMDYATQLGLTPPATA
jgi:hypothetical protein